MERTFSKEQRREEWSFNGIDVPNFIAFASCKSNSTGILSVLWKSLISKFQAAGWHILGSRGRSWRWNARSSSEEAGVLYQYGALELGSALGGEPLLPVEHGERYSWQPMLLGRWMIVFCSCTVFLGILASLPDIINGNKVWRLKYMDL